MTIVLVLVVPVIFAVFPLWMDRLENWVMRLDDDEDGASAVVG
ncbi:hypothetical protein CMUST_14730 [Corynebacterium mustelae]|uniref:Uncharacterized protein n=1 Tax=Corynebacterium mustelae TaxID=571915 RepID=A0A0G3H1G1_9CORY|nr:hypothetical protein [Corynebacterium mustelae]AKK07239.1 hypothetical protein CMUST_14730 [Corynebacterium mustelae]